MGLVLAWVHAHGGWHRPLPGLQSLPLHRKWMDFWVPGPCSANPALSACLLLSPRQKFGCTEKPHLNPLIFLLLFSCCYLSG